MMKRITCLTAVLVLLLSLAGCGSSVKANSTYTGTVTAIDDKSITLETDDGKVTISLTENTRMTMGSFGPMGSRPEGDFTMPADGERPEQGEMPEGGFQKPEGDFTMPEGDFTMPEGDFTMPEGEMPSFPEGEAPDFSQMPEDMTRPEGDAPEGFGGGFNGGFGGGFGGMDISSITVGTSVTVTTGEDKTAATISISMDFSQFGGERPGRQSENA